MAVYHIGLAVTKPMERRAQKTRRSTLVLAPPKINAGFATRDPEAADGILRAACLRGAYGDGLVAVIGSGYGRYERPFASTVGRPMGPTDWWAVVCYDERPTGLRPPPFVAYGGPRHVWSLEQFILGDIVRDGAEAVEPVAQGTRECGIIPPAHVPTGIAAMFASVALGNSLRF